MSELCRTTPVAYLADDHSDPIVINFPTDHFLLFQIGAGILCSVYAFKEYVDDHIATSIVTILIGVTIILVRAKFKIRPPEWALVDHANRVLRLKQRWPNRSVTDIDISKLKSVEAYVPRFQRFAHTILNLHFDGNDKVTIIFDVASSETRFFASPNEVVPPSVEELVRVLQKFTLEKDESK